MNDRALMTLGVLLATAARGGPTRKATELHGQLRAFRAREPTTAALGAVLAGATAFYLAERAHNPKVTSYYDALVYSATNLSVGYSDVLAHTSLGKVIGSLLMTYGPGIAAKSMDAPAPATAGAQGAAVEPLREIAETLRKILTELDARRAPVP